MRNVAEFEAKRKKDGRSGREIGDALSDSAQAGIHR